MDHEIATIETGVISMVIKCSFSDGRSINIDTCSSKLYANYPKTL